MITKFDIIDYGHGNVGSCKTMFDYLGVESSMVSKPQEISQNSIIILPGVGSFDTCMFSLKKTGFYNKIKELILSDRYLVGICIGMQMLLDGSEEGNSEGFGYFNGYAKKFDGNSSSTNIGIKEVIDKENKLKGKYYFIHSYFPTNTVHEDEMAFAKNYINFPCWLSKKNVIGVQFHPERSSINGRKFFYEIIKNYEKNNH